MDYDGLEVELVGVLNDYFSANNLSDGPPAVLLNTVFGARQFPEDQTELLQTYEDTPGGLVNVLYSDSSYGSAGGVMSAAEIVQDETVRVAFFIQANKMRGSSAGYKLLAVVKKAILGYRPADSKTRMWLSEYGDWRLNTEEGEMRPYLEFSFVTLAVQQLENTGLDATIDSISSITEGGPLVEVDQSLYILPDTETVVSTTQDILS